MRGGIRSRKHVRKHAIHVLEHVTRGDAHDAKARSPEHCIARSIAPRPVAAAVALAIDFDDQPMTEAGKVHCHFTDRKLFPELQAIRSLPQLLPEQHLRQAHAAA
jgi:hypothetical protein